MISATTPQSVSQDTSRIHAVFGAWLDAAKQYRLYRRTLTQLTELGDRELEDIGLSRHEIARAAWETATGTTAKRSAR